MPAPVLPTTAVVWPGPKVSRHVLEHGLLGAGVAELDVAELDHTASSAPSAGATGADGVR